MKVKTLMLLLFFCSFLIALHQFLNWGHWFEFKDIHHETFIITLLFASILLYWLVSKRVIKPNKEV